MYKWWHGDKLVTNTTLSDPRNQIHGINNRKRITGRTGTQQSKSKNRAFKNKHSTTYHKVHWTRPRTRRPIRLDKHIGLCLVHNFRVPRQFPSITRRPTYILQFEHYSENFSDGLYGILNTGAVVESGTVEVVWRHWTMWVYGSRVGEFLGLDERKFIRASSTVTKTRRTTYVEVSIFEASPDTVASLDLERWEAISLRDWSINGDVTPETCELRVEA